MDENGLESTRQTLAEHGYNLMEQVGMGSYGQVYTVASHRYEGVIFVAKVIRIPEAPDNQISRDLFNREVSILRTLDHPHIVSFFDSFPCGDDFVLILEYCDRGTIDRDRKSVV
jgi:serine/threonine protein kinase